jgi:hypothetical protein
VWDRNRSTLGLKLIIVQNYVAIAKLEPKPHKFVVFELGSPRSIWGPELSEKKLFREFLEACSICKKKLDIKKDTYMYGYVSTCSFQPYK